MPPAPASPAAQKLPTKEANLFKLVLKNYETKQYKKGVKNCDAILKKFPDHGETLAMKGLILSFMNKKDEARVLAKLGVSKDMTSHVCWHVYGLLYRMDKEYDQAIRCYRNALKRDPENIQILRDLAQLQVHMKDYEGYVTTRRTLLMVKSNLRLHWMTFAVANHLNEDYDEALKVLKTWKSVDKKGQESGSAAEQAYENSELAMYEVTLLTEKGSLTDALHLLDNCLLEQTIIDVVGALATRASLLEKLGRLADARATYFKLIETNAENRDYILGYLRCGPAHDQLSTSRFMSDHYLVSEFATLQEAHPRSIAVHRMVLDLAPADSPVFARALAVYLLEAFTRGAQALYPDLRNLYLDKNKVAKIEQMILACWTSLEERHTLPTIIELSPNGVDIQAHKQDPQTIPLCGVFVPYYLCQHFIATRSYSDAMRYIERAIAHTPTMIELYIAKAKLQKRLHDYAGANATFDLMLQLDGADRYLNNKAAKALLRSGDVDGAIARMAVFIKDSEAESNLYDLQNTEWALDMAAAYMRRGEYGPAVRCLNNIIKFYDDHVEEQYDFHLYTVRKMNLNAYVEMIRWANERAYGGQPYRSAVSQLVKILLQMTTDPTIGMGLNKAEAAEYSALTEEAEKTKWMTKWQKAQAKKEANLAKKDQETNKPEEEKTKKEKKTSTVIPDKFGKESLARMSKDPLAEARKLLRNLETYSGWRSVVCRCKQGPALCSCNLERAMEDALLDVHTVAYDVYAKSDKPLLLAKGVVECVRCNPAHTETMRRRVSFLSKARDIIAKHLSSECKLNDAVAEVFAESVTTALTGTFCTAHGVLSAELLASISSGHVETMVREWAKKQEDSGNFVKRMESRMLLRDIGLSDYAKLADLTGAEHEQDMCVSVYRYLQTHGSEAAAVTELFVGQAKKMFPLCPIFM